MNSVLMNAILSMDSYNRGYNASIRFGNDADLSQAIINTTKIGNATITGYSDVSLNSAEINASFYAIAYDYNGQKIIAYRGTDDLAADPFTGWNIGAGVNNRAQARMAFEF